MLGVKVGCFGVGVVVGALLVHGNVECMPLGELF